MDIKKTDSKKFVESLSPAPGFFRRWSVGETYPVENKGDEEFENIENLKLARRKKAFSSKRGGKK